MSLRFVLLLLGVPLLAHGAEAFYFAARNLQMATVTCSRFMHVPPDARWLRVTGCDIDYTHPAFSASGSRIDELFFAMRLRGDPPNTPAALIVATRDARALEIAQQGLGNGSEVDEEVFTVAMLRVVDQLRAAREVDGYARNGLVQRALTRQALAGFSAPIAPDVIVLDLHAQPSLIRPGAETAAGLLLIGAAAVRRRREARVESPPGPAVLPVELERRLPPAMLLNLESAEPAEIEYAPPLGRAHDVAARISGVLGPLTDRGSGRYSVGATDWRLDFDFGRDDSVWTVAVEPRGSGAALDALDTLARSTGWHVYIPRLGTFR